MILSQVELLLVSPVSLAVVLTELVRQRSVTCAAPVACSHRPRSGESGTSRSARAKSEFPSPPHRYCVDSNGESTGDMPPAPRSLLRPFLPSCWPVGTESPPSPKSPWSSTPSCLRVLPSPRLRPPLRSSPPSVPVPNWRRSRSREDSEPERARCEVDDTDSDVAP
jgi:hypothetical protein